jgi:hypothetical protein
VLAAAKVLLDAVQGAEAAGEGVEVTQPVDVEAELTPDAFVLVVSPCTWEQVSMPAMLFVLPIAVWEFSFGVRMAVKGFTRTVPDRRHP